MEVNIQWAIQCVGYGHLEGSKATGRAIVKEDSPLRTTGVNFGLHPLVLQWLNGNAGFEGPTLHLPAEIANQIWETS